MKSARDDARSGASSKRDPHMHCCDDRSNLSFNIRSPSSTEFGLLLFVKVDAKEIGRSFVVMARI